MFQGNYFGKGNTTTYDRGQFHPVTAPETTFTKYAVNWTQETTTWLINDAPSERSTLPTLSEARTILKHQ